MTSLERACGTFADISSAWLDELVRDGVKQQHAQRRESRLPRPLPNPEQDAAPSACLFLDVGDWLVQSLTMMASLAERLSDKSVEDEYAALLIEEMGRTSDYSDIQAVPILAQREAALRALVGSIRTAARGVEALWETHRAASFDLTTKESLVIQRAYHSRRNRRSSTQSRKRTQTRHDGSVGLRENESDASDDTSIKSEEDMSLNSPDVDASIQVKIEMLMESLSGRGKGQHTCPYQHVCRKGGVGWDGHLVVFERNSTFK
jgi:hypothetical protein